MAFTKTLYNVTTVPFNNILPHWYCVLPAFNKAKSIIFQSTVNFKIFTFMYVPIFVHLPTVRPGCARIRALNITLNNRLTASNLQAGAHLVS